MPENASRRGCWRWEACGRPRRASLSVVRRGNLLWQGACCRGPASGGSWHGVSSSGVRFVFFGSSLGLGSSSVKFFIGCFGLETANKKVMKPLADVNVLYKCLLSPVVHTSGFRATSSGLVSPRPEDSV